jgi:hypothetical protein
MPTTASVIVNTCVKSGNFVLTQTLTKVIKFNWALGKVELYKENMHIITPGQFKNKTTST